MNRPQQIRSVFSELRAVLGDDVSSRELLEAAYSLVELVEDEESGPGFSLRIGGQPFAHWSLDRVFADGGWKLLAGEYRGGTSPDDDLADLVDVKKVFSQFESEAYA